MEISECGFYLTMMSEDDKKEGGYYTMTEEGNITSFVEKIKPNKQNETLQKHNKTKS